MTRQSSRGVSSKRLITLTARRLQRNNDKIDLYLVAYFCKRQIDAVNGWIRSGRIDGGTALKLWHLLEVAGVSSPELAGIRKSKSRGEYIGRLMVFGVISMDEARQIGGDVNAEAVFAAARDERDFHKPNFSYEELVEMYDDKLDQNIQMLKGWMENGFPEELKSTVGSKSKNKAGDRERRRTRGGQPVEAVKPMPRRLPSGVTPATFAGPNSRIVTIDDSELEMPEQVASAEQNEAASATVREEQSTDAPASEELPTTEQEKQQPAASSDPNESLKEDKIESPTAQVEDPTDAWTTDLDAISGTELHAPASTPTEQDQVMSSPAQEVEQLSIEQLMELFMNRIGATPEQLMELVSEKVSAVVSDKLAQQASAATSDASTELYDDKVMLDKLYEFAQLFHEVNIAINVLLSLMTPAQRDLFRQIVGTYVIASIKTGCNQLASERAFKVAGGDVE